MMSSKPLHHADLTSPAGVIRISGDLEFIHEVTFANEEKYSILSDSPAVNKAVKQLDEYFSGTRKIFSLPIQLEGTDFRKHIWSLLQQIPYGKTISYLELAIRAGNPKSIRAVGLANGANKLAIVIPCHRVIGSNGKLVGYAGGLWRKEWLLRLERKDLQPELFEQEQLAKKS